MLIVELVSAAGAVILYLFFRRRSEQTPVVDSDRLFALWISLAAFMVLARRETLASNDLLENSRWALAYVGLGSYQDIFLFALLAWTFRGLLELGETEAIRSRILTAARILAIVLAVYVAANVVVFFAISNILSLNLIALGRDFGAVLPWVMAEVTKSRLLKIGAVPVFILIFADLLCVAVPNLLARLNRAFFSAAGVAVLLLYLIAGEVWTVRVVPYRPVVANAVCWLVASFLATRADLPSTTSPAYLAEFQPHPDPESTFADSGLKRAASHISVQSRLNVVMIVMESVGAHDLELYGAHYHDTPELLRLARHGTIFLRAYAANPSSSDAMGSIFCSIFPGSQEETITSWAPNLAVPGLAQVIAKEGYRVAFMHSGDAAFDGEKIFLKNHGFAEFYDQPFLDGRQSTLARRGRYS